MKIDNNKRCERQKAVFRSDIELERHRRILIAIYAYAYEIKNDPIVSDEEFDRLASEIVETKSTGNEKLDDFFKNEFDMFTSLWIHKHPELDKIAQIYSSIFEL